MNPRPAKLSHNSRRNALQARQGAFRVSVCLTAIKAAHGNPDAITPYPTNNTMNWNHNLQDNEAIEETAFNQMMEDLNASVESFPEEL